MLSNLFAGIRTLLAGIGATIMDSFESVSDAVIGLGLKPIAGFIGSLINVLINGICSLMALLAEGTIGLFNLSLGEGQSVFEIALSGGSIPLSFILQVLALSILALIYFSAMIKMMSSPTQQNGETQLALTLKTMLAGIFICCCKPIIYAISKYFNIFYSWALGVSNLPDLDFSGFATTAQKFIQNGDIKFHATTQIASIATCMILLFIVGMIALMFFRYMFEVSQRYVLFHIMILTAPLLFGLAASKSTSRSFGSWIRMFGSQLVLMVTNVVVLNIFFHAFANFGTDIFAIGDTYGYSISVLILWALLLYSILYVGTKLDTYLRTLGLSTAETGGSMMADLFADIVDIGILEGATIYKKGGRSTTADGVIRGPLSRAVGGIIGTRPSNPSGITIQTDKAGAATSQSIQEIIEAKAHAAGGVIGRGVLSNMSGIPVKEMQKMNPQSAKIQNGVVSIDSFQDKNGKVTSYAIASLPDYNDSKASDVICGRKLYLGGKPFMAIAHGAGAKAFNVANPSMQRAMDERFGEGNATQLFIEKNPTGVWQHVSTGESGKTITQWAPTSQYQSDGAASVEKIGNLDYYRTEVFYAHSDGERLKGFCEIPVVPEGNDGDKQEWIASQFPHLLDAKCKDIQTKEGIIRYQRGGDFYEMAPIAEFYLKQGIDSQVLVIEANNLTRYYEVCVDESKGESAYIKRPENNGDDSSIFASERSFDPAKLAQSQAYVSEIFKEAKKRTTDKRKQ